MPDAILQRIESTDEGTFGRFTVGRLAFYTGELPWRDNAPSVSCIPAGTYSVVLSYSPRFGYPLYLLGPTGGRAGIRIHAANLMGDAAKGYKSQLNGCIALGERIGWLDGQKALVYSRPAVRRLESYCGRAFSLEIRDAV